MSNRGPCAPGSRRDPGTGSIYMRGGKYFGVAPRAHAARTSPVVAWGDSRRECEQKLAAWLKENGKAVA